MVKRFVVVALVAVALPAMVMLPRVVDPVAHREVKFAVPVNVGFAESTMLPVPVTALLKVTPP